MPLWKLEMLVRRVNPLYCKPATISIRRDGREIHLTDMYMRNGIYVYRNENGRDRERVLGFENDNVELLD
jgi:hypothetical protein